RSRRYVGINWSDTSSTTSALDRATGHHQTFPDLRLRRDGLLRTRRRSIRAPTMHTAKSTFRADSLWPFHRDTPYRFGYRLALRTWMTSRLSPSCVNDRSSISRAVRSAAAVSAEARFGEVMSHMTASPSTRPGIAHTWSWWLQR